MLDTYSLDSWWYARSQDINIHSPTHPLTHTLLSLHSFTENAFTPQASDPAIIVVTCPFSQPLPPGLPHRDFDNFDNFDNFDGECDVPQNTVYTIHYTL